MAMSAGRPSSARVGQARIALRQRFGLVAALLGVRALARIAGHRPGGVVELQIAAAGVVEGADRRPIGFGDIVKERVQIGIDVFADGRTALPEMQRARRRYRHFRHDARVRLQKLEMLEHRMTGETDLAVDLERVRLGLHAVELDAVVGEVELHAVEAAKKSKCHQVAAKLAVGGEFQPDLLLLLDRPFDLAVFDRAQCFGSDLVALAFGARLFQRRRPQQASDMVGAERRRGALHRFPPGGCRFPVLLILGGKAYGRAERDLARRVSGCKSRCGSAKCTVTLRVTQSAPIVRRYSWPP